MKSQADQTPVADNSTTSPAASDMPAGTSTPTAPVTDMPQTPVADPSAPVAPTVDAGTDMGSENSGGMPQV